MRSYTRTFVIFLLVVVLVACQPSNKSYTLTENILSQIPVPDDAVQLYTNKIERLAKTGMGTHFGVRALYGADTPYSILLDQYSELLAAKGWQKYRVTPTGSPEFCHPDYNDVSLGMTDIAAFDGRDQIGVPQNVLSEAEKTYGTIYVVTIVHFPFDETGACK